MTTTLGFMVVFNFANSGKFNFSFFFDKQNKTLDEKKGSDPQAGRN